MAHVLVLSAHPSPHDAREALLDAARADRFGVHALTDDPARADVILFVEDRRWDPFHAGARAHPYVRTHREKCFAFCEFDDAVPFLPGVYTGVCAGRPFHHAGRTRTGFYATMYHNPFVEPAPVGEPEHLYAFVGAVRTAPVRARLAALDHRDGVFVDTAAESARVWAQADGPEKDAFRRRYAGVLRQARFVLCPRGFAPSTVRVFEAMRTGRAPVILSDAWVPPEGPRWDEFAVRVPERDAARVPAILRERAADADAMGTAARAAWDEWFAEPARFHRITEWCLGIAQARRLPEALLRFHAYAHFARPRVAANLIRHLRRPRVTS